MIPPPGSVDQDDAIFHLFKFGGIDEVAGFVVERYMYGNDVGGFNQFLKGNQPYAEILYPFFRDVGVAADNFATKRLQAGDHAAADLIEPDDTGNLVFEFHGFDGTVPFPALDAVVGFDQFATGRQDKSHGVFNDTVNIAERCVADNDPFFAGRFEIDVSSPTPALATTLRFLPASSSSRSALVALRITRAS